MNQPIMNALDAVAGSQASAYITMADGNRYCFMQLYSFESNMEINVAEVPILGKSGTGEWPAWSQPVGAVDTYPLGAKVSHNGKKWVSTAANNVWEPGVYGWEEVV